MLPEIEHYDGENASRGEDRWNDTRIDTTLIREHEWIDECNIDQKLNNTSGAGSGKSGATPAKFCFLFSRSIDGYWTIIFFILFDATVRWYFLNIWCTTFLLILLFFYEEQFVVHWSFGGTPTHSWVFIWNFTGHMHYPIFQMEQEPR